MVSKTEVPNISTLDGISPDEFRKQASRIKQSQNFASSKQLQIFLDLLTNAALNSTSLNQDEIGAALGLHDFDQTKPTVRIAARRLRSSLIEFYASDGKNDPIIVEFPKGRPYRLQARKRSTGIQLRSDQAFHKYTEGRMLWAQRTPETLRQAISCFEEAIRLDPHYADPHAALAECYLFMAVWGVAPRTVMPRAKRHAQHAVKINPLSAEAYATLGGILSGYDWEWAKAWKAFNRAFELDAQSVTAHCLRAAHFLSTGNPEAAAQDAHLTLKLTSASPSPLVNTHVAKILYAARKYEEAEDLLIQVAEIMPAFYMVHWQLGLVLASKGNFDQAVSSLETAVRLSQNSLSILASLGWVQALIGHHHLAEIIIQQMLQARREGYVPGTDIAMVYSALGQTDLAFEWLNRACRDRALFLSWLSVWPPFEALYQDRRSVSILAKMNMTSPQQNNRQSQTS